MCEAQIRMKNRLRKVFIAASILIFAAVLVMIAGLHRTATWAASGDKLQGRDFTATADKFIAGTSTLR